MSLNSPKESNSSVKILPDSSMKLAIRYLPKKSSRRKSNVLDLLLNLNSTSRRLYLSKSLSSWSVLSRNLKEKRKSFLQRSKTRSATTPVPSKTCRPGWNSRSKTSGKRSKNRANNFLNGRASTKISKLSTNRSQASGKTLRLIVLRRSPSLVLSCKTLKNSSIP